MITLNTYSVTNSYSMLWNFSSGQQFISFSAQLWFLFKLNHVQAIIATVECFHSSISEISINTRERPYSFSHYIQWTIFHVNYTFLNFALQWHVNMFSNNHQRRQGVLSLQYSVTNHTQYLFSEDINYGNNC